MTNAFTPWFDLMLGHATPLQRAAWFVLGSVEREQRLNLDALTAHWLRAPMAWWAPPARQGDRKHAAEVGAAPSKPPRRVAARTPTRLRLAAAPSARHAHRGRHIERTLAARDAGVEQRGQRRNDGKRLPATSGFLHHQA